MTQPKLLKVLRRFLINNGYKVKGRKSYLIAEGNIPIALVAHLDTVSSKPPTHIFYDNEQHVMWSPELLGADDRAGVYAIVQIINAGYRPHVIFTTDEEIGAIGAQTLVTQKPKYPLENLKAIFQLDRHGREDCVFYDCDNKDFVDFVESFGFKTAYGSFSDISVIAPAWEVAAANLSVGYYNEHQEIEHLFCDELELTIDKVKKILEAADDMPKFKYIPMPRLVSRFVEPLSEGQVGRCICCGLRLKKDDIITIHEEGYHEYDICEPCYEAYWKSYNNF